MTPEERQAARAKIRDQGFAMMDAIKDNSPLGEDDPRFWAAMEVTLKNMQAFDERQSPFKK